MDPLKLPASEDYCGATMLSRTLSKCGFGSSNSMNVHPRLDFMHTASIAVSV